MPRRNLYFFVAVLVASFLCYQRADSRHRNHYASMTEAFVEAMAEIRDHYLFEVDEQKLFEGAMTGLADQLDEYSGYSGAVDSQNFREQLDQQFVGIGIEVEWDAAAKVLRVGSPMIGTPAYESGLMAGDEILKIDDAETGTLGLEQSVQRIKGKPGEAVRLTIRRPEEEVRVLEIVRAEINVASIRGDRRKADGSWDFTLEDDPEIGYVRISQFGQKTTEELHAALEECRARNIRGLILDLRGNPGGLLEAAHEVCDLFIKEGVIVTIRERPQLPDFPKGKPREEYRATGNAPFTDWPMAVLVNRRSASASEIVAACLQDHGRAIVVGERSVGKGTVQSTIDLGPRRGMLRLTVASYWRPSDRNIHRREKAGEDQEWGVVPTAGYEVKLTADQLRAMARRRHERDVVRRPGDRVVVPTPLASATPSATAKASPPAPTPTSTAAPPTTSTLPPTAKPTSTHPKPLSTVPSDDATEEMSAEETEVNATYPNAPADGTDLQLKKAHDYLREKLGQTIRAAA